MVAHPPYTSTHWLSHSRNLSALAMLTSFLSLQVAGCSKQSDEPSASACDTANCGKACSAKAPCPAGTYCDTSGTCTADCASSSDCGNEAACSNGRCSVAIQWNDETVDADGSGEPVAPKTLTSGEGGLQQVDPQLPRDLASSACSGWTTELETIPAVLQFVIDTSYSMAERNAGGTIWNLQGQGPTKWQITHDALLPALDGLAEDTAIGMVFFPNHALVNLTHTTPQPVSACFDPSNAVAVDTLGAAGSAQRTALTRAIGRVQPNGNTPTLEAYSYGVQQLQAVSQFVGQKYIVLLTDGVPTFGEGCLGNGQETANNIIPTDPIVQLVANAAAVGIKTFVIGAPGSQDGINGADARPWLSAAARAGETAAAACDDAGSPAFCHMDMTQATDFAAALRAGLGMISSRLGNCQYSVPQPPTSDQIVDVNQLNVFVNNDSGTYLLLPSTQTSCSEGWQLVNGNIQLCPASCDRAQSDPTANVQILAGCTTQQVIDNVPLL